MGELKSPGPAAGRFHGNRFLDDGVVGCAPTLQCLSLNVQLERTDCPLSAVQRVRGRSGPGSVARGGPNHCTRRVRLSVCVCGS